ncbi:MAG: SPASM domain-containing protein [bacterium]
MALKLGIFPAISTKFPLSRNKVSRLTELGLKRIQNGKVTICEQLTQDDFVVGDLNHQSINDVWNSERILKFRFPPREFFQRTHTAADAI